MVENPTPKLQKMRNTVKEDLKHIPKGSRPQQELRMMYQMLRMRSLGKKGKGESRSDVLKEAVKLVKQRHPGFEPQHDADYFKVPD